MRAIQLRRKNKVIFLSLAVLCLLASGGCKKRETVGMKDTQVVATVGGEKILAKDLNSKISGQIYQLEQTRYRIQMSELENMVAQKLLDTEAASRNVSKDELIRAEVEAKVTPVTDAQIDSYYDANKKNLPGDPKEIKGRIRAFFERQENQKVYNTFISGLKSKHNVTIALQAPEAPKYEVKIGDSPVFGKKDAPITIVEFSDFQCPFCKRSQETVRQVKQVYGDKIRFAYKQFPLSFHPQAQPAAEASLCANEQGKFWEYKERLFSVEAKDFSRENFIKWAGELGMKEDQFSQCVNSGKMRTMVEADVAEGQKLGMSGTPTFFVNGEQLSGAQPFERFKEVIDRQIAGSRN